MGAGERDEWLRAARRMVTTGAGTITISLVAVLVTPAAGGNREHYGSRQTGNIRVKDAVFRSVGPDATFQAFAGTFLRDNQLFLCIASRAFF